MTNLLDRATRLVAESGSPIGFAHTGTEAWPQWDRFLTIDGKHAYHIGNICGTCHFFFERLEGANKLPDAGAVADRLAEGLRSLDASLLDDLGLLMPIGNYSVVLLRLSPQLVSLGQENDYFASEQIANEGIDRFWGLPHYPKVPYYRLSGRSGIDAVGNSKIFDFVVPMFPEVWLDEARIEHYVEALLAGKEPTAVAISVLDAKEPATQGNPHWCMAHYLIDGHHKIAAAARAGGPLTLIAFVAIDHGVSSPEEIATALATY